MRTHSFPSHTSKDRCFGQLGYFLTHKNVVSEVLSFKKLIGVVFEKCMCAYADIHTYIYIYKIVFLPISIYEQMNW